jgi:general stress protein 26
MQSARSRDTLGDLQRLLDRSAASAGTHLRRTFEFPEHALSAAQLVTYWNGGVRGVALATVTARGAPRVAPVESLLRGAAFFVPTAQDAARVRQVRAKPEVSFTHWESGRIAVIVHGRASILAPDDPAFAAIDASYRAKWWEPLRAAGQGVYLRIAPQRLFVWAADPRAFSAARR